MARFVKLSDWKGHPMRVNMEQIEFFTQRSGGSTEIVCASGSTVTARSFEEVERALTQESSNLERLAAATASLGQVVGKFPENFLDPLARLMEKLAVTIAGIPEDPVERGEWRGEIASLAHELHAYRQAIAEEDNT